MYALPSKNVPVLVGMRELKQMGMILNTGNCHALIGGHPQILSKTSKGHALLDFATDIPYNYPAAFQKPPCLQTSALF